MTRLSLEEQIEAAWFGMSPKLSRYYLTDAGMLKTGKDAGHEVGWYTRKVGLGDFRDDVYWTFDRIKRA